MTGGATGAAGGGATTRREALRRAARLAAGLGLAALGLHLGRRGGEGCPDKAACGSCGLSATCADPGRRQVWQIDPALCVQCGRCATACVLTPSAVKCVHAYEVCGYCNLCFAYYRPGTMEFGTGAEKELCPTAALARRFIEEPYYEYTVDEPRCIGCAKCVKGCQTFGNGSLFLQVRHDRCVNCNQCAVAAACPAGALRRVDAARPYLLKGKGGAVAAARNLPAGHA